MLLYNERSYKKDLKTIAKIEDKRRPVSYKTYKSTIKRVAKWEGREVTEEEWNFYYMLEQRVTGQMARGIMFGTLGK